MTTGSGGRSILSGGGEMGALMRSIDWSKTAVGPVDDGPRVCARRSASARNGLPHVHRLGADYTQFYNDGYRPILGSTKHPMAMGISTRETFAEIWTSSGRCSRA